MNSSLDSNILFIIYTFLDGISAIRCSRTCKKWYQIYSAFPIPLWKALCKNNFQVSELYDHDTFKQLYQTHYSITTKDYNFIGGLGNFRYSYHEEYSEFELDSKNSYFAWPISSFRGYMVTVEYGYVCWLDYTNRHISQVCVSNLDNVDWSTQNPIVRPEKKLSCPGSDSIGLLLSNGKGTLIAFDQKSTAFVFYVPTFTLKGIIDASEHLDTMISMNTYKDKMICGGVNGKVGIWNSNNLQLLSLFEFGDGQELPNNVAMWEYSYCVASRGGNVRVFDLSGSLLYTISLKEYIPVSNPQTISTNENDQQFENDTRNIQLEVGATVIELGTVNETVTNQGILVAETMEEITDGLFDVPSDHSDNSLDLHDLLSELPPTILSMNGHFIITNNPARTGIMLWDTKTGTLIDTLTETSIVSNVIDQNIRIGEVSRDGTMIFATTDSTQVDGRLLLWDYSSKSRDIGCRVVHLQNAVEQHPLSIFFCAPTRQV